MNNLPYYLIKPIKHISAISLFEEIHTYGHSPLRILGEGIIKHVHKEINLDIHVRDYFYLSLEKCELFFDVIVKNVPEEFDFSHSLKESLRSFLFNPDRNKRVISEFYSRL